ncbi:unnamed protein product [Cylindrotheca closterium]|uniref:Uncharacterized protein n=1 Tax=Cylindrotheca closterium TaxID=2856 RepID=A0AAD2CMQ9_9STRA|nr:unnamed protein product [Cylindrotheca closterium]
MPPISTAAVSSLEEGAGKKLAVWEIHYQPQSIKEHNLDRRNFVPIQLWNTNKTMFGEKGSITRKRYSRFINNTVKRVGIETYIKSLKKHKIEMLDTTRAELKSNEENPVDADDRMGTEEIEEDKPTIEQRNLMRAVNYASDEDKAEMMGYVLQVIDAKMRAPKAA